MTAAARPLRVLHVDAARDWRGGERQLLLLAQGLRERGVEPLVVARPVSPLLQRCKTEGIATAAIPMRNDLDLLAVRRLRRLLTTWRPHVVHAHDGRSHALALAALVGRGATPLVVTRRSAAVPRGLVRFGPRVARFVAISEAVRESLQRGGVPETRITVAYPGVAARSSGHPRDWRAECGWPADTVVAGIVGPLAHDGEAAALERLLAECPQRLGDRVGVIVLGGHASGRTSIAGLRAFRAGFVHEVPQALGGLDLLLHPGGAEGMGTAVIEAMALGVPTVAFALGGLGEIIESGRNGVLVPAGDAVAFAREVTRLVEEPDARRALATNGPARAERFGPERMVDALLGVYRELAEHSGA